MTSNEKKNRIFGIDLGTTYSCIAYVNDVGKTEVVPNSDGDLTTPSVVYFEDSQNVVVGKTAKEELKTSPERVISLVKRSMGEPDVRFSGVADSPLSPQEVSAHILRKLVKDAQDYTRQDEPIKDVVITCPAYFGFSHKEATRQAGRDCRPERPLRHTRTDGRRRLLWRDRGHFPKPDSARVRPRGRHVRRHRHRGQRR